MAACELSRVDEVWGEPADGSSWFTKASEWRNHYRVKGKKGGSGARPASERYEKWTPERRAKTEQEDPFFILAGGRLVTRGDVQEIIERAAVAAGASPKDVGTHSLRIGGASALYAKFRGTALVQRWGRWKGDASQCYSWEDASTAKGVAEQMAIADVALV